MSEEKAITIGWALGLATAIIIERFWEWLKGGRS